MATLKITSNPSLVHVQLITDTGARRTIEATEAGEFIIPAKDYRRYIVMEERPEAIFQFRPESRAYFLSSTNGGNAPDCGGCPFHAVNPGTAASFPRCSRPSCMGVCRG